MADTDETPIPASSPAPRPFNPSRWWIVGAIIAVLTLLVGAVGVTTAIIDDDDDDCVVQVDDSIIDDHDDDCVVHVDDSIIVRDRAARLAVAAVGGGTVTEIELDVENGVLVYQVEVQDDTNPSLEHDVVLDARTGKILTRQLDS